MEIARIEISLPTNKKDCAGTSINDETTRMLSNKNKESNARSGNLGNESILVILIETPTNINPVSAAAEPAVATKKSCHSFIFMLKSIFNKYNNFQLP